MRSRSTATSSGAAGKHKWFLLERNRLFSVLANYEARTLALLSPLLIATELGLLGVAAYGGWLPQKLKTYASVFALRKRLMEQRRAVQASRRRSDAEVLSCFEDRMDSALSAPSRPGARQRRLGALHAPGPPAPARHRDSRAVRMSSRVKAQSMRSESAPDALLYGPAAGRSATTRCGEFKG